MIIYSERVSCSSSRLQKDENNKYYRSVAIDNESYSVGDFAIKRSKQSSKVIVEFLEIFQQSSLSNKALVNVFNFARDKAEELRTYGITKYDEKYEVVENQKIKNNIINLEDICEKCDITFVDASNPKPNNLGKLNYFCKYIIKKDGITPRISQKTLKETTNLLSPLLNHVQKYNSEATPCSTAVAEKKMKSPLKHKLDIENDYLFSPKQRNSVKKNLNDSFQDPLGEPDHTPSILHNSITIIENSDDDTPKTLNYSIDSEGSEEGSLKIKLKRSKGSNSSSLVNLGKNQIRASRKSERSTHRISYADYESPKKVYDDELIVNVTNIDIKNTPSKSRSNIRKSTLLKNTLNPSKNRIEELSSPTKRKSNAPQKDAVTPTKNRKLINHIEETRRTRTKSKSETPERFNVSQESIRKTALKVNLERNIEDHVTPPDAQIRTGRLSKYVHEDSEKEKEHETLGKRQSITPKKYLDDSDVWSPTKRKSGKRNKPIQREKRKSMLAKTYSNTPTVSTPTRQKGRPKKDNQDEMEVEMSTPSRRGRPKKNKESVDEYIENAVEPRTPRSRRQTISTPSSRGRPRKNKESDDEYIESAIEPRTPRNRRLTILSNQTPKNSPKTPRSRAKLIRDGVITPSIQDRENAVRGDSTPLMKARSQLHVSHVPTSLPCREKEYSDVFNFLEGKLLDGYGGCMYISGVPGTGKTATVTSVINNLITNKEIPKFNYVSINGMRLTEPRQSYVEIMKQLTGMTLPWEQAQSMLEEKFTKTKKKSLPVVMLIDELDILCTKRQDVVYNLLDWPTKAKNQLIVITIANTMDLPERLLMSRVTSRLGLTRLTFQAYTHKQLQEIVTKRLFGTESFNPDAIQFVSRKVASVSGDARRALDICRRAAEIAELENKNGLVSMQHVNEALNAMITQPKVRAIKHCSRLEQLILQAIVAEVERTGVEETTFVDVYKMLVSVAALDGFKMVSSTNALGAVSRLSACRLILADTKCYDINQRIILNVSIDDVYYALKKD